MMRRSVMLGTLALLAACDMSIDAGNDQARINAADGKVAIDVPGFSAKVKVPGLDLGTGKMDIDGLTLPPGSTVTGVNVRAGEASGAGTVRIGFTNPRPPAAVLAAFRASGERAGFAMRDAGLGLGGSKGAKTVTITADAEGAGSRGELAVVGD